MSTLVCVSQSSQQFLKEDVDIWSTSLECHQQEHQNRCGIVDHLERGNKDDQRKRTNEPSQERHKPRKLRHRTLKDWLKIEMDGINCSLHRG